MSDSLYRLLSVPTEHARKIIPQLYETAAWHSSMNKGVLKSVMASDPDLLLRGDLAAETDEEKSELTSTMLALYEEHQLFEREFGATVLLSKLRHRGIADLLRPYVAGREKCWNVRRLAIDAANWCKVDELADELATLALERTEPLNVRDHAAHAVAHLSDEKAKARLKPLLEVGENEDPQGQLRGNALRANWPSRVSARELFACLNVPSDRRYCGSLSIFVHQEVQPHLKVDDLPLALEWVRTCPQHDDMRYRYSPLVYSILELSWMHLKAPGVLDAMCETVAHLFEEHLPLHDHDGDQGAFHAFRDNLPLKKEFTKRLMERIGQGRSHHLFHHIRTQLLRPADLAWLLEEMLEKEGGPEAETWCHLAWQAYFDDRNAGLESLHRFRDHKFVQQHFRSVLGPIDLESEEARHLKKAHNENEEHRKEHEAQFKLELLVPSPTERVQHQLDRLRDGHENAWYCIIDLMFRDPYGRSTSPFDTSNLEESPVWESCHRDIRESLVNAGYTFLEEHRASPAQIGDTSTLPHWASSAYFALHLLCETAPSLFGRLSNDSKSSWSDALVRCTHLARTEEDRKVYQSILSDFLGTVPDATVDAILRLIRREEASDRFHSLHSFEDIRNERFQQGLEDLLDLPSIRVETYSKTLEVLLKVGSAKARSHATVKVEKFLGSGGGSEETVVRSLQQLLLHTPDGAWDVVGPVLKNYPDLARRVIENAATDTHRTAYLVGTHLPESYIGELLTWIFEHYSEKDMEQPQDSDGWTAGMGVREWYGALISCLEGKGTPAAIQAIQNLVLLFPNKEWLRFSLFRAKTSRTQKSWQPYQPKEVTALLRDKSKRLVNSGDELLEVVIESFERFEKQMRAEGPLGNLWNEVSKKQWKPKEETHLSQNLAQHLKNDLVTRHVVVNREVEVRPRRGSHAGEETDILVTATRRHGGQTDQVRVIVEVKGCWNKGLFSDMKDQLVDRYLRESDCEHGLYLVGWFECDQWNAPDTRTRRRGMSLEGLKQELSKQSEGLSSAGVTVKSIVADCTLSPSK